MLLKNVPCPVLETCNITVSQQTLIYFFHLSFHWIFVLSLRPDLPACIYMSAEQSPPHENWIRFCITETNIYLMAKTLVPSTAYILSVHVNTPHGVSSAVYASVYSFTKNRSLILSKVSLVELHLFPFSRCWFSRLLGSKTYRKPQTSVDTNVLNPIDKRVAETELWIGGQSPLTRMAPNHIFLGSWSPRLLPLHTHIDRIHTARF